WVTDPTLAAAIPPGTEVLRVRGGSALAAWLRLRRGRGGERSGRTFSRLRRASDWWLLPDSYAGWARRARGVAARRLARGDEPATPADAAPADAPPDGRFRIVFTGTLSLMPDTEVFLEALHQLLARRPEARRRVRAVLAGPFDTGYRDRAEALGLTGIV